MSALGPTVTREECERLRQALVQLGAVGAHQAVPRRLVADRFGSDRRLRLVMAAAPGMGIAVGSSGDGYYVIERPEDADRCVAELQSRIDEMLARVTQIRQIGRDLATCGGRLF